MKRDGDVLEGAGYKVINGGTGERLELRSSWDTKIAEVMRQRGIRELELNYAKGFAGRDVSFLREMTWLQGLVLTHRTLEDDSPVQELHGLRLLELNTYCQNPIEFAQFPELEECALEWRRGATSLFQCNSLQRLFVNAYSGKVADSFGKLRNLTELSIANGSLSDISGLEGCERLGFLGLYNLKRLTSLQGLSKLTGLQRVEINGCRNIGRIDELAGLERLRVLHLCDDGHIQSFKPIAGLVNLEEVLFYESTNVLDGDLGPVIRLPRLKKFAFAERVHYSRSRRDFEKAVTAQ